MRSSLFILCAVFGAIALPAAAHAEGDLSFLQGTTLEREALTLSTGKKHIKAREVAARVLKKNPDSFLGNWVMTRVFHYEEGNNPRSLYLLRKAKAYLLKHAGDKPTNFEAIDWHKRLLKEEVSLLGEIDRQEEKVALVEYHDSLYQPSWERKKMWPLMKLRRFKEARALGKRLILSDRVGSRITGYNGLQALESEASRPMESWKWVQEGLKNTQNRSCILFFNGASTAWQALMFDKAEELARKAQHAGITDCGTSHYFRLVDLYTIEGRFQEALSAYRGLRAAPVRKEQRQQVEKRILAFFRELTVVLGQFKTSERLARNIYKFSDRSGTWSTSGDQAKLYGSFGYYRSLKMSLEQKREQLSIRDRDLGDRVDDSLGMAKTRLTLWELKRVALRSILREDSLVKQFQPYQGAVNIWHFDYLLDLVGLGVARDSLARAKALKIHEEERARPFYDAMEGWLEFRAGNSERAIALGRRATETLPKEVMVARMMVRTWLADLEWESGNREAASRGYHEVLTRFPTAFRLLGTSLAVRFSSDNTPEAREAVERLQGSRRFTTSADSSFLVHASTDGGALSICLRNQNGNQYNCVRQDPQDEDASLLKTLDLFQDRSFSPKVELTQSDIDSLDGRTVRVDSDVLLQDVLDKSKDPSK